MTACKRAGICSIVTVPMQMSDALVQEAHRCVDCHSFAKQLRAS